ncbi:hypothetical protein B0H63DRAFT_517679 [Podospora didyma]|uniref:HTH La-type RNA-binding domain-containing protein n=1 Tax=Podospora didyma TaxID=330526 RepID=A0AAE0P792_9PEZI|nr:hypothetical protein B0H63DRAFT_517679 [Podospora didyma]
MSSTTFSYAQAAKGQTIPQPSPQLTMTSPPSTSSLAKDDMPSGDTSVSAPSVTSNESDIRDTEKSAQLDVEAALSRQDSEVASIEGSASSTTASAADQSVKTSRDSDTTSADSQHPAEDKSTSSSRNSRLNDNAGDKKARKGRKGRTNDKDVQGEQPQDEEKEAPKLVVLSEAPLPAINVWLRRAEAAKAKQAPVPASSSVGSQNPAVITDAKKRPSAEDGEGQSGLSNGVVNGDKLPRKAPEVSRSADQTQRRSAPRGSRVNEKDEKSSTALPPVADASSWPDPKSAAATEEQSRKPQEKADKPDAGEKESQDDAGPAKKKNWVKVDVVPTVVFATMPARGGPKSRGGARGGRESGSARGSHTNSTSPTSATAPGPVTERSISVGGSVSARSAVPRAGEGNTQARVTSQAPHPHAPKRASLDGASSRDQSKTPISATEHTRDSVLDQSAVPVKKGNAPREGRHEPGLVNTESGSSAPRVSLQERPSNFHAKGIDGAHPATNGQQQYTSRGGRSGGGFRSRAGPHGASIPHPQSPAYVPSGYPAFPTYQSRQHAPTHSPPAHSGQFPGTYGPPSRQGRGGKWASQNIRPNSIGGAFVPKPQPNEFPVQQYAAYPFYQPFEQSFVGLAKAQLEYYLSVENLCKDFYLRQRMDGQGFVALNIIAGFKRMRELAEKDNLSDPVDLLRLAASLSESLEFVTGDDGIERVRLRDKWAPFVLPIGERAEDARNGGPASWTPVARGGPQVPTHYPVPGVHNSYVASPAMAYTGYPEGQMYQPEFMTGNQFGPSTNGAEMNGHHFAPETPLSAIVPEYSPPAAAVTLESMTSFSNSQVENLIIVVDEEKESSSPESTGVAGFVSDDTHHHGLNGSRSSTDAPSVNGVEANEAVVWLGEQGSGKKVHRPYSEVRQEALDLRRNANPGETPQKMKSLYKFWADMLLRAFNDSVYREFMNLATEDASQQIPAKVGLKYLREFYEKLLFDNAAQKPWPEDRAVPNVLKLHYENVVNLDHKHNATN